MTIFHTRVGSDSIFPKTDCLRNCFGVAMYRVMQIVMNRHHHLIYQKSEKSSEKAVMTKDMAKAPTTNMERGINACWMVLSIKSQLKVIMALGI